MLKIFVDSDRNSSRGSDGLPDSDSAGGGVEDDSKVLDILARHPATARFIADDPPRAIDKAAAIFGRSGGDIPAVMRAIVGSPEFFSREAYRGKVKKTLEYVASALRITGAVTRIAHPLLRYLSRMGEPLFMAQPPTGHPDVATSWISADMLLTRMNFASARRARPQGYCGGPQNIDQPD